MAFVKKSFLYYLTPITALLIAFSSAFFSVFGLSKLFAGAALSVIIMGGSLEVGKLLSTSYLYLYFKTINIWVKFYLFIAIFVLMIISSAGIYSFLTNAYQQTANKLEISNQLNQILTTKKLTYQDQIKRLNDETKLKQDRLLTLSNLRNEQEDRLTNVKYSIRKFAANNIVTCDAQILSIQKQLDSINNKITIANDSIAKYDINIITNEQTSIITNEIGPLKYLSNLLNIAIDKIVNWITLLLIFVFDPLAVVLIIASNHIIKLHNEQKKSHNDSLTNEKLIVNDEQLPLNNEILTIEQSPKLKFEKLKINDDFILSNKHKPKEKIKEEIVNDKEINNDVVTNENLPIISEVVKNEPIKIENNNSNLLNNLNVTNNGDWPGKTIEVHPHDGGISVR